MLIPGIMGNEPIIQAPLGNKIATAMGNLAYGVYLIHFLVVRYELYSRKTTYYFSYLNILVESIKNSIITLILAFILHIFVE